MYDPQYFLFMGEDMKRLVVCCDGTWQSLDNDWPTNVQRIAQFVMPTANNGPDGCDVTQIVYYDSGVGTGDFFDKYTGGMFGNGLDVEIRQAYRFLSLNYEDGDEIYLFGFSRGAYTVRSLAGLIYSCGLISRTRISAIKRAMDLYRDSNVKPSDDECVNFRKDCSALQTDDRPPILFLGCWDTVGSLGVPDRVPFLPVDHLVNEKYEFHDLELGAHINTARHAVAIDEARDVFDVSNMKKSDRNENQDVLEVWFPGDHGSVGGGERGKRELSDCALLWMIEEASAKGLQFDADLTDDFTRPNPLKPFPRPNFGWLNNPFTKREARKFDGELDNISDAARKRWKESNEYRPETLQAFAAELNALSF